MSSAQLHVLSVDGYVIGAYTTERKAKAAWRRWCRKDKKLSPEWYQDGFDIFKHTTITQLKGVDIDVIW